MTFKDKDDGKSANMLKPADCKIWSYMEIIFLPTYSWETIFTLTFKVKDEGHSASKLILQTVP